MNKPRRLEKGSSVVFFIGFVSKHFLIGQFVDNSETQVYT
jgi:hypothetical protein